MVTRTQIDPTPSVAGDSQVSPNRRCNQCMGMFPIAHFSLTKYGPNGYSKTCKECYSQYLRLNRQKRYNAKSRSDDSIIRSIKHNNEFLLQPILGESTTYELAGLSVLTGKIYKIYVGKDSETSMNRFTIFDVDGSTFFEVLFMGGKESVLKSVNDNIRGMKIRLCPSVADAEMVKKLIYFF